MREEGGLENVGVGGRECLCELRRGLQEWPLLPKAKNMGDKRLMLDFCPSFRSCEAEVP